MAAAAAQAQKVYWVGRHAVVPELGSPVSKVHKEGLQLLRSMGWTQVQNDTACVPVFAFTTRKGANYPVDEPGLPVVRQLPHAHTACLDDKRSMAQHLTAAGLQQLMPPCWNSIEAFIAAQQQKKRGQEGQHLAQGVETAEQVEGQQEEDKDAVHSHLLQLQLHHQVQLPSCASNAGAGKTTAPGGSDSKQRQDAAPASSSSSGAALLPGGSNSEEAQDAPSSSSSSDALLPGGSVFVKHRQGTKGQAVCMARTMQQLLQLEQRLKGSSRDFVVQQEVPSLLQQGRNFVMMVHVLVVPQLLQQQQQQQQQHNNNYNHHHHHPHSDKPYLSTSATRLDPLGRRQQHVMTAGEVPAAAAIRVYVHEDVIVLQHAKQYDSASDDSAVHISSRGKQHPAPVLLAGSELPINLQDSIWQQLQGLCVQCIAAVSHVLLPTAVHPNALLYHLFGFDCMVNAAGRVLLLEVNSYPAVASGTMCGVDVEVYTRLVGDLVRLLVLPVADASPHMRWRLSLVGLWK